MPHISQYLSTSKILLAWLLLSFNLIACDKVNKEHSPPQPYTTSQQPVRIALLVPAGSGDANLERLSKDLIDAAKLALIDYPSALIDLRVYSTGGVVATALEATKLAMHDGAKLIVGPLFAETSNAVGKIAADRNINVLSFSNNPIIAGNNVFILGNTFDNKADRIVGYAASHGYNNIAVITPDNSAGELAANSVKKAVLKHDIQFAGTFSYSYSFAGIVAISETIAKNIKENNIQAIVLSADSNGGLSELGQMLPISGLSPLEVKYLGITRWDIPSTNLGLPALKGGWFTLPNTVAIHEFNQKFQQAYQRPAHPLTGLAYDSVAAAAQLLLTDNQKNLSKKAFTRESGFVGSSGLFYLNSDGSNQRTLAIGEVKAESIMGEFSVISSSEQSFSPLKTARNAAQIQF